jgi:hypothetical protein
VAVNHVVQGGLSFDLEACDRIELLIHDGQHGKTIKFTAEGPQQVALVPPTNPGDTRVVLVFNANDMNITEEAQ